MEEWRGITDWDRYEVSSLGKIRNKKSGRIIRLHRNEYGYYSVKLHNNGKTKHFKVHRLVAEAFIPNKKNKSQVNHIDGDKTNNIFSNLEWANPSENVIHCYKTIRGKGCSSKPKSVVCVETGKKYTSISEAARCFNVTHRALQRALFNEKLTSCGYHWKFV